MSILLLRLRINAAVLIESFAQQKGFMGMMTRLYQGFLSRFTRHTFPLWQRLGVHVTRCHFYEPVPDTRRLPDQLWRQNSELVGIETNEKQQLELLREFEKSFSSEYEQFPRQETGDPHQYYTHNGQFEVVDGEILYCMIRHFRPKKIMEIGCGHSTRLAAQAILRNAEEEPGYSCELTAIEPYPAESLRKGFPGLTRLMQKPVQEVPLREFEQLGENDMLLIDSSHVLKIGSDVQYEYLEILPRLNKGVMVSFHDIFFPAEYRKQWVMNEHRFWNEQYLLQAFLIGNISYTMLWMGSYMHMHHPDELSGAFGYYDRSRNWPASLWIRKIN